MNNTNDLVGSTNGISKLERARFGPGMLLQHEDLEQLNTYTRDLSRLLFQSFFGCGVVCGLEVSGVQACNKLEVTVQKGLALSCSGDPVYVPEFKTVYTNDNFDVTKERKVWVVLCATKKCCAPRTSTCCSDDDQATSDSTRERDCFEIRVLKNKRPDCACGCPEPTDNQAKVKQTDCMCVHRDDVKDDLACLKKHYDGKCGCECGDCSSCDCQCIVLARLDNPDDIKKDWKPDHRVRRFIRPILMRDPQVEIEQKVTTTPPPPPPPPEPPKPPPPTNQGETVPRTVTRSRRRKVLPST